MTEQATKCYVEAFKDGRWELVETCADDVKALQALVKARGADTTARLRVSTDGAKVLLDVPPVGQ